MMWFVKRDRELRVFAEAIRPELAAVRVPPASADLRARILADRAAGARVILPAERAERRPMTRYLIAAAVVAAAVLGLPFYRDVSDETRDAQPISPLAYLGGVARAQQPPPTRPTLPAAVPSRADRIR